MTMTMMVILAVAVLLAIGQAVLASYLICSIKDQIKDKQ